MGKETNKTERKGRIIRWVNKVKDTSQRCKEIYNGLFKPKDIGVEDQRDKKDDKPETMFFLGFVDSEGYEIEHEPESIYKEMLIKSTKNIEKPVKNNKKSPHTPGGDSASGLRGTALGLSADGEVVNVARLIAQFERKGSQLQGGKRKEPARPGVSQKHIERMESEDVYSVGDQESTRSQDTDSATKEKQPKDTPASVKNPGEGDFVMKLSAFVGKKAKSNGNKPIGRSSKTNGGSKQSSGKSTGSSTTTIRRFFKRR